jgi:hypothetical protein
MRQDVIVTGVRTSLYLDDHRFLVSLVCKPALGPQRRVHRVPRLGDDGLPIDDAGGTAEDDDPMLGAVVVSLVRQATTGAT